MISRLTIALSAAVLGLALVAPSVPAQGRGVRAPAASPRARSSFRVSGRVGLARQSQGRYLNDRAFLYPAYFYSDDELDYQPEAAPVPMLVAQAAQPPAAPASPIEPLLLENRNGQWVRVPTGSQLPTSSQSTKPASGEESIPHPGITEPATVIPPLPKLPSAVIVFHDGHTEEMGKYMIQGDFLYTNTDYFASGSWMRKIPLAQLDIPASLKLNRDRGAKFNLPSAPNEVVIRF